VESIDLAFLFFVLGKRKDGFFCYETRELIEDIKFTYFIYKKINPKISSVREFFCRKTVMLLALPKKPFFGS
jgi:hypothetical protein